MSATVAQLQERATTYRESDRVAEAEAFTIAASRRLQVMDELDEALERPILTTRQRELIAGGL